MRYNICWTAAGKKKKRHPCLSPSPPLPYIYTWNRERTALRCRKQPIWWQSGGSDGKKATNTTIFLPVPQKLWELGEEGAVDRICTFLSTIHPLLQPLKLEKASDSLSIHQPCQKSSVLQYFTSEIKSIKISEIFWYFILRADFPRCNPEQCLAEE